jgi:hypothetical protein
MLNPMTTPRVVRFTAIAAPIIRAVIRNTNILRQAAAIQIVKQTSEIIVVFLKNQTLASTNTTTAQIHFLVLATFFFSLTL